MRESAIVRKIVKAVKEKYPRAYVRKIADRFTRGIPDLIIVIHCAAGEFEPGTDEDCGILFVETKTATGTPSKLQEAEMESIQENYGEAIIARDAETVLAKLEEMGAVS